MNYYLAREGKTYGPYPQEYIPAMVQQGQLVPEDLLCPEGGSDWAPLSQMPHLMAAAAPAAEAAAPAAATGSKLRISGSTSSHSAAPAAASAPMPAYTPAPQRASGMEKAGGVFGVLKMVGIAVVAVVVVGGLIAGFMASQRDKKEIAKLHPLPGWSAFNAANTQIDSESSNEGYGSNGEATQMSKTLATLLEEVQRASFKVDRTPRLRGRSKLGKISSAISAATAGTGHFQTFVELRKDRAVVLVHIPEFHRYKGEARQEITEMCWEGALAMFSALQNEAQTRQAIGAMLGATAPGGVLAPPAPGGAGGRTPPPGGGGRTGRQPGAPGAAGAPGGRPPGARPGAPAMAAPAKPPEPKFAKDLPIVVGVRGKSDYECVFVGSITSPEDAPPTPTKKNVPSHKLLVEWFGTDRP